MSTGWESSDIAGSVSLWIKSLQRGDESAAGRIFERYRERLCGVANRALGDSSRRMTDEEDVVIRAFCAFLRRTESGAYNELSTRADLWRLLATITRSYAWKQSRFLHRLKRNVSRLVDSEKMLSSLASNDIQPDVLTSMSETLAQLLAKLEEVDPELKTIALGRLEGMSNQELAEKLDRSVRTIERRLQVVRAVWESDFEPRS